jgi:phosphoribosylformylglycinamidine cyclo-ligase
VDAAADPGDAGPAVAALVSLLRDIDPGRPRRVVLGAGHYASVLALDGHTGIAMCTDGVGTKVIVAAQANRLETIGIDCVAMNVNDLICVGAEPLAMVDYIAVEQADPGLLRRIGEGLKEGAERAGVEIPGGELAQLPELVRGHPSPLGFDLVGACIGTVALDRIVSGAAIRPRDAVIALPSSGIHANGLTLAREALLKGGGHSLGDELPELGRTLAEELLEPTEIYVPAVMELLGRGVAVHGLAHISGDGLLNLLRLNAEVGYQIENPLQPQAIFGLIQRGGALEASDMYEAFNMGMGFCCVLAEADAEAGLELLRQRYPSASRIGEVTADAGRIRLPSVGITGQTGGFAPT